MIYYRVDCCVDKTYHFSNLKDVKVETLVRKKLIEWNEVQ